MATAELPGGCDSVKERGLSLRAIILLLPPITIIVSGIVTPIWWIRRTRRGHDKWQKRWWAIVLGGLLLFGNAANTHRVFPAADDVAGQVGSLTGLMMTILCGLWLLAWGYRGKKIG
jgi:hypothetical protein